MANDTPDNGRPGGEPPPDDFDSRLKRARESERRVEPKAQPALLGLAFRLVTEFVAGVAVGVFIGWLLDRWLGTTPWLMLLFFGLGTAAGFMNVIRTARQMNVQSEVGTPVPPVNAEDDED